MSKKIPLRKCIVSNERFPKKELLRIIRSKEGDVTIDITGKANGRGAYIHLTKANITKAKRHNIFGKVLEVNIPETIYDELLEIYEKNS